MLYGSDQTKRTTTTVHHLLGGGLASSVPAVTMQDLELEQAELLPGRQARCFLPYQWFHKQFAITGGNNVAIQAGMGN